MLLEKVKMSRRKERKRRIKKVKPYNETRKPYNFNHEVKNEAKKRSGRKGRLEVHHRYPCSLARQNGIAPYLIKSIANAVALPHDEHLKIHSVPHSKEWWDERLKKTKELYIGGIIFLLEYPEHFDRVIYDSKLGEQRKEK